jgi:hypothetical protein
VHIAPENAGGLNALLKEEAMRVFNLTEGPLWVTTLYHLGADEHVLMFNLHHIIADGWSVSVIVDELVHHYNGYLNGSTAPLPELEFQYADFSKWQKEQTEAGAFNYQLEYWKQQLADSPDVDYIPLDKARKADAVGEGQVLPVTFSEVFSGEMLGKAADRETTVFVRLATSFQLYLYFVSGQKDVVVGSNIANRNWEHTEALIGFFVNQLVVRVVFDDNETYSSLLQRAQKASVQSFKNQDVPFDEIVRELNIPRKEGRNPLFQIKLAWQNVPVNPLSLDGLEISQVDITNDTAKFDMVILLENAGNGIAGSVEYNGSIFEEYTIKNIIKEWGLLASVIAGNEQCTIADIRLLYNKERELQQQREHEALLESRNSKLKNIRRREVGI